MQFTRPNFPRAYIEMDMSHDAPNHILIKNGKHEIIKQDVVYENCQKFYIRDRNLGQYVGECRLSPNYRT